LLMSSFLQRDGGILVSWIVYAAYPGVGSVDI
jgi:hypothetical protein